MYRIAIVGYTTAYGGIERMIMNWYQVIDKSKIQFDFIVPHDCGEIAFEDDIISNGGRVFRIIYSERESWYKARKCWKDYFNENAEVIGVHLHTNFHYAFPLIMAKKAGIQLRIIHSHSSSITGSYNAFIQKIRDIKAKKEIERGATHYLACSDKAARFMYQNKEYIWIKNGINVDAFSYDENVRNKVRDSYNLTEKDVLIGMVGHLSAVKNPLFAIDIIEKIVKRNKQVRLFFIGEGYLYNDLINKIEEYNIQENVFLLGKKEDTSVFYQAFDILIMPSLSEGFPVTLVEAQTAGVKCLVSNNITKQVGITDLVRYKSIEEGAEAWAREIDEMLKTYNVDRCKYKECVKNAGFDITSNAKELERIYLSV